MNSTNNIDRTIATANDVVYNVMFILVTYYPLVIIALGILGNTSFFIIFHLNKRLKSLSSMVYLSFVVITDTLSLFIWYDFLLFI